MSNKQDEYGNLLKDKFRLINSELVKKTSIDELPL